MNYTRRDSNTSEKPTGKPHIPDPRGTKSGTLALAELIDAWATLPEAIRSSILAMVRAARQERLPTVSTCQHVNETP